MVPEALHSLRSTCWHLAHVGNAEPNAACEAAGQGYDRCPAAGEKLPQKNRRPQTRPAAGTLVKPGGRPTWLQGPADIVYSMPHLVLSSGLGKQEANSSTGYGLSIGWQPDYDTYGNSLGCLDSLLSLNKNNTLPNLPATWAENSNLQFVDTGL